MSGHTPGPWRCAVGLDAERGTYCTIHAEDGRVLASTPWPGWTYTDRRSPRTEEANALLMADAPDLLAALRQCREALLVLAEHPAFEDDAPEFNEGGIGHTASGAAVELLRRHDQTRRTA